MGKGEATVLADLCEMAADVIDECPEAAARVARRLAKSFRGLAARPAAAL